MQRKRTKRLSKQEAKTLLPIVDEFNKVSRALLKLLGKKIEHKEREVARVAVMVRGISKPLAHQNTTINIKTVDLSRSTIKRVGGFFSQKKASTLEEEIKRKRGGFIL